MGFWKRIVASARKIFGRRPQIAIARDGKYMKPIQD